MSQIIEGTVGTLSHYKDGMKDGKPTGYANFDLVLTDGTAHKLNIRKSDAPKQGQFVRLEPARFGQVTLAKVEEWTPPQTSNGGEIKSSPNGGGYNYTPKANSNEGYWAGKTEMDKQKADYEQNYRDKKIERQTYIRMAVDAYNAGLPHQTEIPNTPEEINTYFQMAVDLGESVYQTMSKK